MQNESEYIHEINEMKKEAISDLEDLLNFAKGMLRSSNFRNYIKAKTIVRYNTFSALYQRTEAVLALTKANQGASAGIIVRSIWETLAEYDFINLETTNLNLHIRLVSESKQQLANWSHVQRLRNDHPNAETWKTTISDAKIISTIARRQKELRKFGEKYPNTNLNSYQSLLSRLGNIDNFNLSKNPDYKTLTQFDYRTVYSLLSGDTHSTIIGNEGNSRRKDNTSIEIRLESPKYETVRSAHVAYKLFLKFLQNFNRIQKLNKGTELKIYRTSDHEHDRKYAVLQEKYGL